MANEKKLYILNIRYETQIARLFFEGADTEAAKKRFVELQGEVSVIGEKSVDWESFVANVKERFGENGFSQVQG